MQERNIVLFFQDVFVRLLNPLLVSSHCIQRLLWQSRHESVVAARIWHVSLSYKSQEVLSLLRLLHVLNNIHCLPKNCKTSMHGTCRIDADCCQMIDLIRQRRDRLPLVTDCDVLPFNRHLLAISLLLSVLAQVFLRLEFALRVRPGQVFQQLVELAAPCFPNRESMQDVKEFLREFQAQLWENTPLVLRVCEDQALWNNWEVTWSTWLVCSKVSLDVLRVVFKTCLTSFVALNLIDLERLQSLPLLVGVFQHIDPWVFSELVSSTQDVLKVGVLAEMQNLLCLCVRKILFADFALIFWICDSSFPNLAEVCLEAWLMWRMNLLALNANLSDWPRQLETSRVLDDVRLLPMILDVDILHELGACQPCLKDLGFVFLRLLGTISIDL